MSMKEAGILPGDILVVDRSLDPVDGKIVIAAVNNELTVKRLYRTQGKLNCDRKTRIIQFFLSRMTWNW